MTQRQRTEKRKGKVPKLGANPRPTLDKPKHKGMTATDPITLGDPDDGDPVLVRTTGAVFNLRAGQQRWVTGTGINAAVERGLLEVLDATPPPPPEVRPTPLRDGTPGSAPELPGRLDQWKIAFTPCIGCSDKRTDEGLEVLPASPGSELCEFCLAERDGETPLERALRLAGS